MGKDHDRATYWDFDPETGETVLWERPERADPPEPTPFVTPAITVDHHDRLRRLLDDAMRNAPPPPPNVTTEEEMRAFTRDATPATIRALMR